MGVSVGYEGIAVQDESHLTYCNYIYFHAIKQEEPFNSCLPSGPPNGEGHILGAGPSPEKLRQTAPESISCGEGAGAKSRPSPNTFERDGELAGNE